MPTDTPFPEILFEDNHLLAVNKPPCMLTQKDSTGDSSILEEIKTWIKIRDSKPGNVFMGLPHRLDRPVGGVLVLSKTSKSLSRLSESFRSGLVNKTYWAIVESRPASPEGLLIDWLLKKNDTNTSRRVNASTPGAKEARLDYRLIGASKHYWLLEVSPRTGRHHQIRVQLAGMGCPVKGDLKYGSRRSESGGGILLHAKCINFPHPITGNTITIEAPLPNSSIWTAFTGLS